MHATAKVRWAKAQIPYRRSLEGTTRVDLVPGIVSANLGIARTEPFGWFRVVHIPSGWVAFHCYKRRDAKAICEMLIANHDLGVIDRAAATPDGSIAPGDYEAGMAMRRAVNDMKYQLGII
jgi:hypothetical protein